MERAKRELAELRYAHRTSATRELVRERLDYYGPRPRTRSQIRKMRPAAIPARFAKLITEVEERHGLEKKSIFTESNVRMFVEARQEAFVLLRAAGLSYQYIAYVFGMHHTSVLHQVRKAQLSCAKDLGVQNGSV